MQKQAVGAMVRHVRTDKRDFRLLSRETAVSHQNVQKDMVVRQPSGRPTPQMPFQDKDRRTGAQ